MFPLPQRPAHPLLGGERLPRWVPRQRSYGLHESCRDRLPAVALDVGRHRGEAPRGGASRCSGWGRSPAMARWRWSASILRRRSDAVGAALGARDRGARCEVRRLRCSVMMCVLVPVLRRVERRVVARDTRADRPSVKGLLVTPRGPRTMRPPARELQFGSPLDRGYQKPTSLRWIPRGAGLSAEPLFVFSVTLVGPEIKKRLFHR